MLDHKLRLLRRFRGAQEYGQTLKLIGVEQIDSVAPQLAPKTLIFGCRPESYNAACRVCLGGNLFQFRLLVGWDRAIAQPAKVGCPVVANHGHCMRWLVAVEIG